MVNYKLFFCQIGLLIAVFGVALITLSCRIGTHATHIQSKKITDTNVVIVDTDKFSIAVPKGWNHFVKESQGYKILFLMSPSVDNFSPNLNILTEDTHGLSEDEYMKESD